MNGVAVLACAAVIFVGTLTLASGSRSWPLASVVITALVGIVVLGVKYA